MKECLFLYLSTIKSIKDLLAIDNTLLSLFANLMVQTKENGNLRKKEFECIKNSILRWIPKLSLIQKKNGLSFLFQLLNVYLSCSQSVYEPLPWQPGHSKEL
jgi:hypothetical protein